MSRHIRANNLHNSERIRGGELSRPYLCISQPCYQICIFVIWSRLWMPLGKVDTNTRAFCFSVPTVFIPVHYLHIGRVGFCFYTASPLSKVTHPLFILCPCPLAPPLGMLNPSNALLINYQRQVRCASSLPASIQSGR